MTFHSKNKSLLILFYKLNIKLVDITNFMKLLNNSKFLYILMIVYYNIVTNSILFFMM
jgi:hypothetical protein